MTEEKDKALLQSMEQLGISEESITSPEDKLYDAMVLLCQETGEPCSAADAGRKAGFRDGTTSRHISRLIEQGRAFRVSRYGLVPNVASNE